MSNNHESGDSLSQGQKSAILHMSLEGDIGPKQISDLLEIPLSEIVAFIQNIQVQSFQFNQKVAHGESVIIGPEGPERTRRTFATHHLTSAAHNARIAGIIEQRVKDRDSDEIINGVDMGRFETIHDSHVITSIISSFAGVETAINEFLHEVESGSPDIDEEIVDSVFDLLSVYPGEFMRDMRTEAKYQLVLNHCDRDTFNTGEEPWQSLKIVRELRNYFVHHKPEILELPEEEEPSARMGRMLETQDFDLNPQWTDKEAPFFPHKCLSYGLCRWVFSSCTCFIEVFYEKIDSEPPYQPYEDKLKGEIEIEWSGGSF